MQNSPKADIFEVPNSNLSYCILVYPDSEFIAYVILANGEYDYANPVKKINKLHRKIRQSVQLHYDRCVANFEANKKSVG